MTKPFSSLLLSALFGALLVAGGCRDRGDAGAVSLYARSVSARDPRLLEIQAQVSGSLEGVHYKWFAAGGECNPQETNTPVTRFRFANGAKEDQITVDVFRESRRIGRSAIEVKLGKAVEPPVPSNLKIEVTEIPLAERGGPDTRAFIAGRVTGDLPPDSHVVIYARDDGVWYIQPSTNAKHKIGEDGSWSTWTHSGSAYAVLVVPADFVPLRNLDTLPAPRGDVFVRTVVDGRAK